jgi:hypothetical protein
MNFICNDSRPLLVKHRSTNRAVSGIHPLRAECKALDQTIDATVKVSTAGQSFSQRHKLHLWYTFRAVPCFVPAYVRRFTRYIVHLAYINMLFALLEPCSAIIARTITDDG